jgi:hypothetical protein
MCKKLYVLVPFLFACSQALPQDRAEDNLAAIAELDRARALLEESEAELGRYSQELIEPIEQLVNRLMALNQFEDADTMLDRAVQITRINNGLHTPAQLNLIRKRIDNFANRGDWDEAREQMEYLFNYYLRVPILLNESLLNDFLSLADQHIRGATADTEIEQGRHLSRVYQLNWAMISTARKLYGDKSPELVPYLYRQVQLLYTFKKGRDDGGRARTNANFYYTLDGRTFGWPRITTKNRFYQQGLQLLAEIRDIYDEHDESDSERLAMSALYIGDWFMLFDHADLAVESYESVYSSLLGSGLSQSRINAFFSVPRTLPLPRFYASVDAALEELDFIGESELAASEDEVSISHALSLHEWSEDYPTLSSPTGVLGPSSDETDVARFSFELLSENEPTFLYSNRFRQSVGIPVEVEMISGFRGMLAGDEIALDRFDQLRFRPKLVDGEVVRSRNTLVYSIRGDAES